VSDSGTLYDDGRITCDDEGLTLRWYYLWGHKRIPYRTIRSFRTYPLTRFRGKWRLWGSGDFVHYYNLDGNRSKKDTGIAMDVGGRIVIPCITPDDPEAVARILAEHGASSDPPG
jgi:Bacterial PH domain